MFAFQKNGALVRTASGGTFTSVVGATKSLTTTASQQQSFLIFVPEEKIFPQLLLMLCWYLRLGLRGCLLPMTRDRALSLDVLHLLVALDVCHV